VKIGSLNQIAAGEIRAEMARQGLTQRELAARLGWNRMSLSRRLSGGMPLSLDDIEGIAAELGVSVTQFIDTPSMD
jgi:transcriptional regulator with XRE-family HTH domain